MPTTRRPGLRAERRAEARARLKTQPKLAKSRPKLSPIMAASLVAGVVGVALVIILILANANPQSGSGPIETPTIPLPSGLAHGRALGEADAPVTIDIWADFQCPICKEFYADVEPQLRASYVQAGTVQLVFHDYAFIGQASIEAAAAARVSEAIGPGFWPFHDLLYANQGAENGTAFSQDRLASMAVLLGMDRTAFVTALADPSYATAVNQETAQGGQLGIDSTPTLVIDGKLYPGLPTFAQLSAVIDGLIGASPSP